VPERQEHKNGEGAANIMMVKRRISVALNANCSSGGTTTTNQNGYYDFLLDKGPCTIAPQLKPGYQSTPVQRALDVTADVTDANFQVPCGAVPPRPPEGGPTAARMADGLFDFSPNCPVKVWVVPMENPVKSGLHYAAATGAAF
jgi:hypothetical protein